MFPTSIVRVAEGENRDIRHLARWRKKKDFTTENTEGTEMRRSRLGFRDEGEVLHGVVGFDEAAEAFHNLGTIEEFAEEIDFLAKFRVGEGRHEFFVGEARLGS